MIDISQKEFESKINDIVEGKYTRADLIKELKVDRVTLNSKIQELYVFNQKLYLKFIERFPYIPREYTHIDYEAMIIDIMKKGYTKKEAAEQYGIHDRTIARKINKVEKENPELVSLYREVAYYRKHKYKLPENLQKIVDDLEEKEVFIGGIYDKREEELLAKEKQYNATKLAGISDTKAYGNKRTIKDFSNLYRLEIEKTVRQNNRPSDTNKYKNNNIPSKSKVENSDEEQLEL